MNYERRFREAPGARYAWSRNPISTSAGSKPPEDAEVFFERLNTLVIARHNLTPVSRAEYETGFRRIYSDPSIGVIFAAYHEGVFLGGAVALS